jgi:hypothetical protein
LFSEKISKTVVEGKMVHERQKGEGVETSDGIITTGMNSFPYFFPYLLT